MDEYVNISLKFHIKESINGHCFIPVRILVSTNFPYGATDLTPKTFPKIAHKTKQIVYPQPILKSNEMTSLSVKLSPNMKFRIIL